MVIVQINNNNYGSTGNIMANIAKRSIEKGHTVYTCCKNSRTGKKYKNINQIFIGIWLERIISEKLGYLTGYTDHFNIVGTLLFIKRLKKIRPNIIHLHNIHGSFINLKLFFKYINENNIPIIWTFHDIWPITGQCTTYNNCNCFINQCDNCKYINKYPSTLVDKTNSKWKEKKQLFSNIKNLQIVVPSSWLKSLLELSYLKNKPNIVINNGINLNIFKPSKKNNVKNYYKIENNKFVILGVANYWNNSKGLDTFINLSKDLNNDYQIILVGTNKKIDKSLPNNIISINKTDNIEQLVAFYSIADLFINPTIADNFPSVNIEALACGTPVLTYDTGGAKEMLNEKSGMYVQKNDYIALIKAIKYIKAYKPFDKEECIKQAYQYNINDKYDEYIQLFVKTISQ